MYCIVSSAYVKVNRKNEKVAMALARNCETVQDRQQFNLGWLQQLNSARSPQRLRVLLRSDERPRWLARVSPSCVRYRKRSRVGSAAMHFILSWENPVPFTPQIRRHASEFSLRFLDNISGFVSKCCFDCV